jgi:hypothetical protein
MEDMQGPYNPLSIMTEAFEGYITEFRTYDRIHRDLEQVSWDLRHATAEEKKLELRRRYDELIEEIQAFSTDAGRQMKTWLAHEHASEKPVLDDPGFKDRFRAALIDFLRNE